MTVCPPGVAAAESSFEEGSSSSCQNVNNNLDHMKILFLMNCQMSDFSDMFIHKLAYLACNRFVLFCSEWPNVCRVGGALPATSNVGFGNRSWETGVDFSPLK